MVCHAASPTATTAVLPSTPVLAPRHFSAHRRSRNAAVMEEGKNSELSPNSFPLADSELLLKDADVKVSTMEPTQGAVSTALPCRLLLTPVTPQ